MRCPFCGNEETQVKDSRPAEEGSAIRRRRHCAACGARFTTFERVQLRELVVVKKDGTREPFDREKLARSIRIAVRKRPVEAEQVERMWRVGAGPLAGASAGVARGGDGERGSGRATGATARLRRVDASRGDARAGDPGGHVPLPVRHAANVPPMAWRLALSAEAQKRLVLRIRALAGVLRKCGLL